MELKAELKYPYTEEERVDFIVEQNHNKGYEIREHATSFEIPDLQAWGPDDIEELEQVKNSKYEENNAKANTARYGQEFTLIIQDKECVFDTNQTTQADLLTAFAVCSTGATYDGWVTNNGVVLNLTMEDIVLISTVFKEKSNVYGKWNEYKTMIDNAQTLEEVEAIIIDYEN